MATLSTAGRCEQQNRWSAGLPSTHLRVSSLATKRWNSPDAGIPVSGFFIGITMLR